MIFISRNMGSVLFCWPRVWHEYSWQSFWKAPHEWEVWRQRWKVSVPLDEVRVREMAYRQFPRIWCVEFPACWLLGRILEGILLAFNCCLCSRRRWLLFRRALSIVSPKIISSTQTSGTSLKNEHWNVLCRFYLSAKFRSMLRERRNPFPVTGISPKSFFFIFF